MSKTMFDDDLYTGNSVIPAAAERPDREPVVVRRQAALSALIGVGASMLSGLYLWRAVDQGGAVNWAVGALLAGLAMFHITQWIDGRTPLLVADGTGIRLRLGNVWHGLLWQDVSRITVRERQGLLRDGRVVVHPVDEAAALDELTSRSRRRLAANTRMYGAPFAIPLGVTTVASTGDLAGSLAEFAGDTTVVELAEPAPVAESEPDTVRDTDASTEALPVQRGGYDTEPEAGPDTEPDTGPVARPDAGTDVELEPELDAEPDAQAYDTQPYVEYDTEAYEDEAATEPDTGLDGGVDPARETGLDTGLDTGPDAGPDAGPDKTEVHGPLADESEEHDDYDAAWLFDDAATDTTPEPEPTREPEPGAEPEYSQEPEPAAEPEPGAEPEPARESRVTARSRRRRDEPRDEPAPEPATRLEPVQLARPLRRAVRADVTRPPTVRAPVLGQLALQDPVTGQPDQQEGVGTGADQGERGGEQRQDRPRGPRPRGNMSLVLGETPPPLPPEPEPDPEPQPTPVPEETAPDPAANPVIGPVIAEARKLLGLSVDELATRTRIRPHVIEAIEVDDFGPCAGDFYARGHLRALSRVLGVDSTPLLQHFDERYASAPINARRVFEAELAAGDAGPFRGVGHQHGPRWGALVIAVLVLVLVWILVTILGANSSGTSNDADLGSGVPQVHRVQDSPPAGDTA